jgi:hypothetical protein
MAWRVRIGVKGNLPGSDMQERKNKRLLILLIVLLSAAVGVYWLTQEKENDLVDKNIFRDYDLKSINEILLESFSQKISLKYSGTRWKVNDQFGANADMIEVLFATLQQAEPKRPIASLLQDSIGRMMREKGVKVSLFAEGNLKKTFYAGGNTLKSQAYFMDADEGIPYLISIPGYHVYVSGIFELAESGWRDKFVFGFNWRNFQRLEMNFPKKPSDDFVVAMQNSYFSIQGLARIDTTRLNDFLDDVSLLTVDEFVDPVSVLDSLSTVAPLVSILVTDIARKEYLLELYPPMGKDLRYLGLVNSKEWGLFQKSKISGIIHPRNFFAN